MKLGDMFKDVMFGLPQSVGNMIMLPIIRDTPITDVSDDMLYNISDDSDYSNLTLENKGDMPIVIPQGSAFINKQSAQDRTVLSADVIDAKSNKKVKVGCIQENTGGHHSIDTTSENFIPASLREQAIKKRDNGNYSVIWKDIQAYNHNMGISNRAHIHDFYDKYKKELDEFVAQFEPINNQVGAVILINTEVVGIEIFPNYGSWLKVWRQLIRDSYNAEAVRLAKEGMSFRSIINVDKVSDIESLKMESNKVIQRGLALIMDKVQPMLEIEITEIGSNKATTDYTVKTFSVANLMTGQAIRKQDKLVYLTSVRSL